MKIIRPESITDAVLTASNVTETVAVYNAGTTYAQNDVVRRDSDHGLYESQVAGNVGQSLDDPTKWLRIAPTNRWAMFDDYNTTQTVLAEAITGELDPVGRVTGMAFLNLDAASITLTYTDEDAGEVYNQTHSLVYNSAITNWYDYFVEPIIRKTDFVLTDLPVHFGPHIAYSIDAPGGTAKCGNLVIGQVRVLGETVLGPTFGQITYSKRDPDEFGNINIVPRTRRKSGRFEVVVARSRVDEVGRLLGEYTDTPVVWVGTGDYALAQYFGIWRDWDISPDQYLRSILNIQIEALS